MVRISTEQNNSYNFTQKHVANDHIKEITAVKSPHEFQEFSVSDYLYGSNILNFIIVAFFIVWAVKKFEAGKLINKKKSEITEIVNIAEKEKITKKILLNETQTKVRNVNFETSKIMEEGNVTAAKLSDNISLSADKQAENLRKKAEISAETYKQTVSEELTAKITCAAFYIAEEHIKQSIDERLHQKYIDEFTDNLDKINI